MRVIYSVYHRPHWIAAIERLREVRGWEPVYLFSDQSEPVSLRAAFPNVTIHNVWDAWRGLPAPGREHLASRAFDAVDVRRYERSLGAFLAISVRGDSRGTFSCRDQQRLYRSQLMYWTGVVEDTKPDLVVFHDSPHSPHEFVLYLVCREAGVPTLFFQRTPLDGYCLLLDRIDALPIGLEPGADERDSEIEPRLAAYLARLRGEYQDALPDYMRVQAERVRRQRPLRIVRDRFPEFALRSMKAVLRFWRWPDYIRRMLSPLWAFVTNSGHVPWMGQRLKPPRQTYASGARMSYREWLGERRYARRYGEALAHYYESVALAPDLGAHPYVYVPLHYQPERTTAPDGGAFTDQWLMVNLIAAAVPDSWMVYVKEHPSQVSGDGDLEAYRGRAPHDYDEFLQLPNVRVVSQRVSSFDLADGAVATATVTGTAGWESIVRGKHALVFGNAWYRWARGAHHIQGKGDIERALDDIVDQPVVESDAARSACLTVQSIGFRLDPRGGMGLPEGMSDDENVDALVRALSTAFDARNRGGQP